jgi:hypothetical protein
MEHAVPPTFDETFLTWFRERTESTWSTYPTSTLERFAEQRRLGCDWQPGTKWLGGLEQDQIDAIERAWALRFPPDHRLFLQRLHAVDRALHCAAWSASPPHTQTLREAPAFYNWLTDGDILRTRLEEVVTGLQFAVEEADLWRPVSGNRPATAASRADRVRGLVAQAPRLIPVFGHRYLLAEPTPAGHPVFSIMQSDIIIYGADLRTYFLADFADLLDLDREGVRTEVDEAIQAGFSTFAAIPFWGDLLDA